MSAYQEVEQYILDIPRFAGKHTLEDTKKILRRLIGDKIESKVIHIAGTNGKGSVCAYLRSVLVESGCSVGMFTSPHLETMRERICLGNEMISEEDFVATFDRVLAVCKEVSIKEHQENLHPSFFEFLYLMAMSYYKEKKPDYLILETGLGGRLDATNSVEKPELCVITEIGYDHMQYLGDTLLEIAEEKAGIIKPFIPVVFFDKRKEVTKVLKKCAEKQKSQTFIIKKDNILNVNSGNKTIDFSFETGYYSYDSLSLSTTALYQTENAALAIAAAELLSRENKQISREAIRKGVQKAFWPGRMEEIEPGIYFDGAHNEDGIEAFLKTVVGMKCEGRRFLLFGVVSDKRYERMIAQIAESGLFTEVAVTILESDRSASLDELRKIWGQYKQITCSFHQNANEAYHHLLSDRKDADVIYIAGSLYLIAQMKALVRRKSDD